MSNTKIVWHLATKDPNGNPTHGITRRRSYLSDKAVDFAKFDQWPADAYVNVWLVRQFAPPLNGINSYSLYPATAASLPYFDGVICLASLAGDSITIIQNLAHTLNLKHNTPTGFFCYDDVDDTPQLLHILRAARLLPLYDTACATGYFRTYTPSQALIFFGDSTKTFIDYPDTVNAQNVMNYGYFCSIMFTHLQAYRMRAALNSTVAGRNNLHNTGNLIATGV